MSVVDQLLRELEENPEKAKRFIDKIAELYPEIKLSTQLMALNEKMNSLLEEQVKIWKEIRELKEEQVRLREETTKIWKEIEAIKQEQVKIWQEIRELKEGQQKIWQEIKAIKEEQVRLREEVAKIWQQIEALKQEQVKLREETTKIWQQIEALKKEQVRLREDFNEMLATIKQLQSQYSSLDKKVDRIYEGITASLMYVFGELSKFAGLTFEEFVRKFLTDRMRRSGEIPEDKELRPAELDGEEVDIFLEDPLIVGEVTAHAESEEEINKLIRKAKKAREIYGKEPRKILIVETARKDVARRLRSLADREGVELIIGKEY